MDIGVQEIVDTIVASATGYLLEYWPLFALMAGLVLAVAVIAMILSVATGRQLDVFGGDEDIL